jgi:hypothetical protein
MRLGCWKQAYSTQAFALEEVGSIGGKGEIFAVGCYQIHGVMAREKGERKKETGSGHCLDGLSHSQMASIDNIGARVAATGPGVTGILLVQRRRRDRGPFYLMHRA